MGLVNIPKDELSLENLQKLTELLHNYNDIFSKSDIDIGHTTSVKHKIELPNDIPFKQRYRRIPPSMFDEVRNHLQQLLSAGIIRRSHSPFASNVVLVKKKTGE